MKKNFNRRVNKAHVSQLNRIISGAVPPTDEIMLSGNGSVVFYENFLVPDKANRLLEFCSELDISVPSFRNFNNELVQQPRASMWFGPVPYAYSKFTLPNHSFGETRWLEQLRADLGLVFGDLNSCLINKYRNGTDKVAWHADNEKIFGVDPTIVSVSLGVTRTFEICHMNNVPRYAEHSFNLTHGSVIVMKGDMQRNYLHRVPVEVSDGTRYNLTFRYVV